MLGDDWLDDLRGLLPREDVRAVVVRWSPNRPAPERSARVLRACALVEEARWTSVAALDGACQEAGVEMAMSCVLRVVGQEAVLRPAASPRLAALVGTVRARALVHGHRSVTAVAAHRIGLVDRIAGGATGSAVDEATALAWRLAQGSQPAQAAVRRCVDAALRSTLRGGIATEAAQPPALVANGDAREGIAAFLERRPPRFV